VFVQFPPAIMDASLKLKLKTVGRAVKAMTERNASVREKDGHVGKMAGSGQHRTHEGYVPLCHFAHLHTLTHLCAHGTLPMDYSEPPPPYLGASMTTSSRTSR
jgi:hypothetical protein